MAATCGWRKTIESKRKQKFGDNDLAFVYECCDEHVFVGTLTPHDLRKGIIFIGTLPAECPNKCRYFFENGSIWERKPRDPSNVVHPPHLQGSKIWWEERKGRVMTRLPLKNVIVEFINNEEEEKETPTPEKKILSEFHPEKETE